MKIIYLKDYQDINVDIKNLSLVLGYFDGVHIGHSQLINYARSQTEGSLGVLTFDRPLKNIEGSITNIDLKAKLIGNLGVDYLFVVVCDDNFKKMSYIDFVTKVLKKINPTCLYCGPDFKYGYCAQGGIDYLKSRFNQVYVLNYVKDHFGEKISSTEIKNLIKEGKMYEASRWLGRSYIISGTIIHGKNNGEKIGFPTANLLPDYNYVIPKNGVYITHILIDGVNYKAITNIGVHPTIDKLEVPSIETYIIDCDKDLYDKKAYLFFLKFLREETKFNSLEDLKNQINKDKEDALHYYLYKKLKNEL